MKNHFCTTLATRLTLHLALKALYIAPDIRGEIAEPDAALQLCRALDRLHQSIAGGRLAGKIHLADRYLLRDVHNPNAGRVMQLVLWANTTTVPLTDMLEAFNQLYSDTTPLEEYLRNMVLESGDNRGPYSLGFASKRVVMPAEVSPVLLRHQPFINSFWNMGLKMDDCFSLALNRADLQAFALSDADRHRAKPLALPPPRPTEWGSNVTQLRGH